LSHRISLELEIVTAPPRIDMAWFAIVICTGTFSGMVSQGPSAVRARVCSTVTTPDCVAIVACVPRLSFVWLPRG
jgi:hypothetical protein